MRRILLAVAVLMIVATAWKQRSVIAGWLEPTPPPKPIVFDNGTVRQYEAASQPDPGVAAQPLPNGKLRKCVRGKETTYTNVSCPPGFKEKPVDASRVNVVPGAGAP